MSSVPQSPQQALPRMTELLQQGASCRLVVTGRSMLPLLRDQQDAVILTPLAGAFRRGDILFYLRGVNTPILHRVVRVCPDGTLLMCGDAQTGLEPIHPSQVLARVSHVERGGRLIPCDSLAERLRAGLWQALYPVRPRALGVLKRLGKLK